MWAYGCAVIKYLLCPKKATSNTLLNLVMDRTSSVATFCGTWMLMLMKAMEANIWHKDWFLFLVCSWFPLPTIYSSLFVCPKHTQMWNAALPLLITVVGILSPRETLPALLRHPSFSALNRSSQTVPLWVWHRTHTMDYLLSYSSSNVHIKLWCLLFMIILVKYYWFIDHFDIEHHY